MMFSTTVLDFFCIPFIVFISFLIILSAVNKSVGVRRAYVKLLLKVFEFGRLSIETAAKERLKKEGEEASPAFIEAKSNDYNISHQKTENSLPTTNGNTLISRDSVLLPTANDTSSADYENSQKDEEMRFNLEKCLGYIKAGVESIIEDEVTSRFEAEELKSWNLLTRTNRQYEFISLKITLIWMTGFAVRYFVLLPLRIFVCFVGVSVAVIANSLASLIPFELLRHSCADIAFKISFRLMTRSLSAVITIHNAEFKPKGSGFCVANHTSPLDIAILSTDCTFSLIGQRHGGFLGLLQRALARASPHIWFERGEAKDRHAVAERLKQHVSNPNNPPILIFPEGTCINNTSVMQFKKGSFEVGGVIYPVAIKYDPRFGDAFWNSSKYSMMQYLYMMMTSWAIVCDVWYLPPMYRQEGESAIDFANRVKSVIAKQGGLVDLVWDGQLKRMKPKKEWKEMQQVEFAKQLKGD
ncbi:glycerol-3-phosphate acyltransferase 3 isoform X1 [Eurosta solidaginis]|uniref:glycerol-3-phosphate acyltransferase 3 isoform X1 n=1 Tax=Eurosta solidaginis TaxID=178769 RepID=UPI003530B077